MKHRFACPILVATVMAVSSLVLSAAEKPAPPKSDPILADLKTSATATWQRDWPNQGKKLPLCLEITVDFQGTAAMQASALGELRLDSVLDEHGKSYRWACLPYPGHRSDMEPLVHNFAGSDEQGFRIDFRIHNRPSIRSIRELRGSVAVETGGKYEKLVVENALKNLGEPAKGETDPDNRGKLVRDKNLAALGITVNVARRPISQWDGENAKDNIGVGVESKLHTITRCEILDAHGKPIPEASSGFSGSKPHWHFDFAATVRVPPDARLRLTIHKNARKLRVPFLLKDIAVPQIDESLKHLDIPASTEDAFVEAETLPPGNPVLAGLKVTAKADWQRWQGNVMPPNFAVRIELTGKTAEETSALGEFDIESAVDDSGKPLVFPDCQSEMGVRFFDGTPLALQATLSEPPRMRKLRELRGSLALQIGGPQETIVVKDFLKKTKKGKPLDDAALKSLGIDATVEERNKVGKEYGGVESLCIHMQWKRNAVVRCEICDAEGNHLEQGGWSLSHQGPKSASFRPVFKQPIPEGVQLRLCVQKNTRKIRVPFAFKDIDVPNAPTGNETPGGGVIFSF